MSIHLSNIIAIGAAGFVSVAALAQPLACTSESPDVACTEQGAVRGIVEGSHARLQGHSRTHSLRSGHCDGSRRFRRRTG